MKPHLQGSCSRSTRRVTEAASIFKLNYFSLTNHCPENLRVTIARLAAALSDWDRINSCHFSDGPFRMISSAGCNVLSQLNILEKTFPSSFPTANVFPLSFLLFTRELGFSNQEKKKDKTLKKGLSERYWKVLNASSLKAFFYYWMTPAIFLLCVCVEVWDQEELIRPNQALSFWFGTDCGLQERRRWR